MYKFIFWFIKEVERDGGVRVRVRVMSEEAQNRRRRYVMNKEVKGQ